MAKRELTKKKPYPEFPLGIHPNGQWVKKIKGKLYYFGTDANDALEKFKREVDDLQAGRTPRQPNDTLTVNELVNRFLASKKTDLASGKIGQRTFRDYFAACIRLNESFGNLKPDQLRPEDFDRFRANLSKRELSLVTIGNCIRLAKIVFNWAFKNELIEKPMRFGTAFEQPSKTALRRAKAEAPSKTFVAQDLRKIIDSAKGPLKAMILLGINSGFGSTDVANLPRQLIDLDAGWVCFPRPKTAIPRRAPLWPETIAALKEAIKQRPKPANDADAGMVFLTQKTRVRWVRGKVGEGGRIAFTDAVAQEFNKLLAKLNLKKRGSFYNLRHTFATEAAAVNDREAVNVVMGHVNAEMGDNYVARFPDGRLQAVVNAVRSWLWPEKTPRTSGRK